jgi:hypothetical protein
MTVSNLKILFHDPVFILFLPLFLIECSDNNNYLQGGIVKNIPHIQSITSDAWIPAGQTSETIIARINGVPVFSDMLKDEFKSEKDSDSALHNIIVRELLAQEAFSKNFYTKELLLPVFKKIIVHLYLEKKFELDMGKDFITDDDLRRIWEKNILARAKYDHADWFSVVDLQIICCDAARNPKQCLSDQAKICFQEGEIASKTAYDGMKGNISGNEDISDYAEENFLGEKGMSVQKYTFFYDVHKPYEKQINPQSIDKPIAAAVIQMKQGELSRPVKSNFGWHILFLFEHVAEEHRSLADESVREEMREIFLPAIRAIEYQKHMKDLFEQHKVFINENAFRKDENQEQESVE